MDNSLKVVFFDFTINFGGAPRGTVSLGSRLAKYFDVHFIDVYGSSHEYIDCIKKNELQLHVLCPNSKRKFIGHRKKKLKRVIAIAIQIFSFVKIYYCLRKKINDIRPNVVWVNNEKSLVFLLGPKLRAQFPVVYYVRSWATKDQMTPLLKFLLKYRVKFILAHARATVDQLLSYQIPPKKIIYTPNSVELTVNSIESITTPPELPGLKSQVKILLPAARPVLEKGHLTAIRALRLLLDRGVDAVLWFPGKNAVGVGETFINELKDSIRQLGLDNRVYFIGWWDAFQQVIVNADLVILPSYTEGFPRVVIESMLLGVPVCSTPVGGVPEAIIHGKTGFIFDIDDHIGLAEQINTIVNDSGIRNKIINNAFSFASKTFIPEVQTEIVKQTFIRATKND